MLWLNIGIFILIVFLVSLYFLPYRKLKDKIFKKLFYDTEKIVSFTYDSGKFEVSCMRQRDVWRMTQPETWLADIVKLRKFILRVSDIQIEERIIKGRVDNPDYDLGRNGTLRFNFDGEEIELILGGRSSKSDELIYVKKSSEKDVLLINASFLNVLPKNADDFKNMLVFEGLYSQIRVVDFRVNDDVRNMTRTDGAWIFRGKNVFDDKVQPVLTALLETEAQEFVDSNMKLPAKPHAFVMLKTTKGTITRHFFLEEADPMSYLMPLDGKIMKVRKSDIHRLLTI